VFELNDKDEALRMHIQVNGKHWIDDPAFINRLPPRIVLKINLESNGPWILREFTLESRNPKQIQSNTWELVWKRSRFDEGPSPVLKGSF
jgi:hypothetical protein